MEEGNKELDTQGLITTFDLGPLDRHLPLSVLFWLLPRNIIRASVDAICSRNSQSKDFLRSVTSILNQVTRVGNPASIALLNMIAE